MAKKEQGLWMLRTSPHNEEVIWRVAKTEEDLNKNGAAKFPTLGRSQGGD